MTSYSCFFVIAEAVTETAGPKPTYNQKFNSDIIDMQFEKYNLSSSLLELERNKEELGNFKKEKEDLLEKLIDLQSKMRSVNSNNKQFNTIDIGDRKYDKNKFNIVHDRYLEFKAIDGSLINLFNYYQNENINTYQNDYSDYDYASNNGNNLFNNDYYYYNYYYNYDNNNYYQYDNSNYEYKNEQVIKGLVNNFKNSVLSIKNDFNNSIAKEFRKKCAIPDSMNEPYTQDIPQSQVDPLYAGLPTPSPTPLQPPTTKVAETPTTVNYDLDAIYKKMTTENYKNINDRVNNLIDIFKADVEGRISNIQQYLKKVNEVLTKINNEIQQSDENINLNAIKWGFPWFCVTIITLFFGAFVFRRLELSKKIRNSSVEYNEDKEYSEWNNKNLRPSNQIFKDDVNGITSVLLDVITVLLITMSILILGLSGALKENVLGTLLGGIAGYILNRAKYSKNRDE